MGGVGGGATDTGSPHKPGCSHVVFIETLSFEEQAMMARASDILVAVHGAALTVGIFMQPGSVVLEVLTSPWYQPFIDVALERFGVRYEHRLMAAMPWWRSPIWMTN